MVQRLAPRSLLNDRMAPPPTLLERCTKPFLWLSLAATLSAATWGVSVSFPTLQFAVPAAFAAAWAAAKSKPVLVRQALLSGFYLVPALFMFTSAFVPAGCWVIWMAPLCGLLVATTSLRLWALPDALKVPLACWSLTVAVTWPIIILREADFLWSRIDANTVWWTAMAAATTILGVLWLDFLFARLPETPLPAESFERTVALPIAAGWALCSVLAIYQLFGDVTFLNRGLWGYMQRARGTFNDANPFGVLSAMWGPLVLAVAVDRWTAWRRALGVAALPLSWLAVWASGSRSSLPIVAVALVVIVVGCLRGAKSAVALRLTAVGAALIVAVSAGWIASSRTAVDSPLNRLVSTFSPRLSLDWVSETAARLNSRDGYGTISNVVIGESPWVGVGVGAFHALVPMYAFKILHQTLVPDNAQNWFRHNLVELGLVGSVGWILWVALLLWALVFGDPKEPRLLTPQVLRGVLVGFGLISLVGMPGQDVAAIFTFWTIAFWYLRVIEPNSGRVLAHRLNRAAGWVAVWAIVLGHAAATAYVGVTGMRPPFRQAAADIDYRYGFYPPEPGGTLRWARKDAVDVLAVPAERRWLQVTFFVQHIDLPKDPVDVKVWANRQLLVQTRLSTIEPVMRYFKVPDGDRRVVLETWVSRTLNPRDFGVPDDRELGLLVDWKFVDAPPPGTVR
jgi:hypothetical protein